MFENGSFDQWCDLLDSHFHEIIHRELNNKKIMAIHIQFVRNVSIHRDHSVIERHSENNQDHFLMTRVNPLLCAYFKRCTITITEKSR